MLIKLSKAFQWALSFLGLRVVRNISFSTFREVYFSLRPVNNGHELIRIGADGDGGYVLPDDVAGIKYVVSVGCGKDWTFERHLKALIRPRIKIIDRLDKKPEDLDIEVDYIDAWLGKEDSTDVVSLDSVLKDYDEGEILLKIDIEGAEFQALENLSGSQLHNVRIFVMEVHGLEKILDRDFYKHTFSPFWKVITENFHLVHSHGNNCCGTVRYKNLQIPRVLELTFHKKSRSTTLHGSRPIPSPLDRKIIEDRNEIRW